MQDELTELVIRWYMRGAYDAMIGGERRADDALCGRIYVVRFGASSSTNLGASTSAPPRPSMVCTRRRSAAATWAPDEALPRAIHANNESAHARFSRHPPHNKRTPQ